MLHWPRAGRCAAEAECLLAQSVTGGGFVCPILWDNHWDKRRAETARGRGQGSFLGTTTPTALPPTAPTYDFRIARAG